MRSGICLLLVAAWNLRSAPLYAAAVPGTPFVDVQTAIPGIIVEVRYATTNNFTGRVLPGYTKPRCWLLPRTTAALARVQRELASRGYGLKVFDGYRPLAASRAMIEWARTRPGMLGVYIGGSLSPARRVDHNCGNAVDLTLVELATGREVDMGTPFDHFGKASWTYNAAGRTLRMRLLLLKAMQRQGFRNLATEWWHYDFPAEPGRVLDLPIE